MTAHLKMNKSLFLLALLVAGAFACSSKSGGSGCGCGGGGGGGCGCKAKARGVLQLEGEKAIEEDFGQIYGLSMWENRKANVSLDKATDPNFLFHQCCLERGLSPACTAHCNFRAYDQTLLQNMLVGANACPLSSLPEIHFCAAQGRDHSKCCIERGVNQVAAGDKCLVFCDQIPDKFTPIDYTYASCFGKFDDMKRCFFNNVHEKAKSYFKEL